jgi:hypothetical protein
MVRFQTKNWGLVIKKLVYSVAIYLEYITAIWYILLPFGNLVAIWYIFFRFGILSKEKSGNPDCEILLQFFFTSGSWRSFYRGPQD